MKVLSIEEAQALIARGALVIDVRNPHEFEKGHLAGSRLVPVDTVTADPKRALERDGILFVCASGRRSERAARAAEAAGFLDVANLDGGLDAWSARGLPLVVPAPAPAPAAKKVVSDEEPPPDADVRMPELDAVIGQNLHALRERRGLTLDQVARLTGLSRTLLGQIENGTNTPSLGVVWRIARGFDVPFATLLSAPQTTTTAVLRKAAAKRLVSADGRFSSRALFPFGDAGKVEFYELWLAGHGREDAEPHQAGTRENLIVTKGRLVLELAGARHELAEGDAIVFAADVKHAYVNPASDECWMHLVMTYA